MIFSSLSDSAFLKPDFGLLGSECFCEWAFGDVTEEKRLGAIVVGYFSAGGSRFRSVALP